MSVEAADEAAGEEPRLTACPGLIGMVDPPALLTASAALNAFHVPVVAVSPGFYSRYQTLFFHTSAPPPNPRPYSSS